MKKGNRIGSVMHISRASGNLILESSRNAKIGETVTDSKGKRVGVVFDVFGPVDSPYASVRTRIKNPERLIGAELFSGQMKK
ncbi:H/ACA RNA-protein complex protein Gar1 [Candidatus Bathyarchaeota archaeon]|nr:H/ACA RNA-protein complex protein Gar1 [Candidatus Bathyarchaeota archaeon]MBL7079663.1 H/ACA RNA-protein complex protein Gar1 [Candidatus Bathyarchaeota archaeon]